MQASEIRDQARYQVSRERRAVHEGRPEIQEIDEVLPYGPHQLWSGCSRRGNVLSNWC